MTSALSDFHVGQQVWINRDEKRYPSQGSWPKYRHRKGRVVRLNTGDGEIGVVFGAVRNRPNGSLHGDDVVSWFLPHELIALN